MSTSPHANRPIHHRALAIISAPLAHAHHRRYRGVPHHLILDTILNVVIYALLASVIILSLVKVVNAGPTMRWDLPTIVSGQAIETTLTVTGSATGTMRDLVITPTFPDPWIVSESPVWSVGSLEAGQSRSRTYRLEVNGPVGHSARLITVASWSTFGLRVQSTDVTKTTTTGSVFEFELTTAPTTDGSGTTTMRIIQRSGRPLDGIRVALIMPPQTTITSEGDDVDGGIWTPRAVPTDTPMELIIAWTTRAGASTRLQFYATLSYQTVGDPIIMVERSIDTVVRQPSVDPADENIGTSPTVAAEVRYQTASGITLGYGPNPPRVGQESAYRLFWYVQPGTAPATNVSVSAVLPAGVRWGGRESLTGGQRVEYSSATRRITWVVGTLASQADPIMVSFDIVVLPTATDRGRTMPLIGQTTLSSRLNTQTATSLAAALTTAKIDGGGAGTGIVR